MNVWMVMEIALNYVQILLEATRALVRMVI